MRLPFLQVHQDDLSRARILARILHIPEAHATGIVVLLDAWALGETAGGIITDTDPAGAVALAVGWEGDAGTLLAGLVRVRLIDELGGNFRVAGTVRYDAALSGPSKRTEAARIAAIERWHGKKEAPRMDAASDRNAPSMRIDAKTQTQTQTQTQKEETDLPPPAVASAASGQGPTISDTPAQHDLLPEPDTRTDGAQEPPPNGRKRPAIASNAADQGQPTIPTPEALQALWNRLAAPKGLSVWAAMGKERRAKARLRLKSEPRLHAWEAFLSAKLADPFNLGENDRGWKADVDWLLRTDRPAQVTDFADSPPPGTSPPSHKTQDRIHPAANPDLFTTM